MEYQKALVTGGAGFIGSHVVQKLLEKGVETVVLDNLSVGKVENIPSGAKLVIADVCDPETIRNILSGVDIVFHLAARVSIRDSFRGFIEDARTNIMGTVTLLNCMEGSGVKKIIYASSMAAYGDARYLPIDEKHAIEPTSPYGVSKLASEKYILCFCKHLGIQPVILRYFNTYGPKQTFSPYVGVITIFIQKLRNDEDLPVFGDGNQIRDFINVDDVARANLMALDYKGGIKIFNVGTGIGTTIKSLAEILKEKMKKCNKINYLPIQAGEPSNSVADVKLGKKELGFTAKWSLQEKLGEVIEWNMKRRMLI